MGTKDRWVFIYIRNTRIIALRESDICFGLRCVYRGLFTLKQKQDKNKLSCLYKCVFTFPFIHSLEPKPEVVWKERKSWNKCFAHFQFVEILVQNLNFNQHHDPVTEIRLRSSTLWVVRLLSLVFYSADQKERSVETVFPDLSAPRASQGPEESEVQSVTLVLKAEPDPKESKDLLWVTVLLFLKWCGRKGNPRSFCPAGSWSDWWAGSAALQRCGHGPDLPVCCLY